MANPKLRGEIACGECGHHDTDIIETRDFKGGLAIRRRRECPVCEKRVTTLEVRTDWLVTATIEGLADAMRGLRFADEGRKA